MWDVTKMANVGWACICDGIVTILENLHNIISQLWTGIENSVGLYVGYVLCRYKTAFLSRTWLRYVRVFVIAYPSVCNGRAPYLIGCKCGMPVENHLPMTVEWSKSKPEVEFQCGGCLFSETESSNISATDWDIWSIFCMPIFTPS